jgi:hypothetical protein
MDDTNELKTADDTVTRDDLINSPIYQSLTQVGKAKAGDTKESILQFFDNTLFPFIHESITDFVLNQIPYWDEEDIKELTEEVQNALTYSGTMCLKNIDTGVSFDIDFLKYIVIFLFAQDLGIRPFIPVHVEVPSANSNAWCGSLVQSLFEAFMFSRLEYLMTQNYQPIVINVAFDDVNDDSGHTIAFLFLPDKQCSWLKVVVDSSNTIQVDMVYVKMFYQLENCINLAWQKYIERLTVIQTDIEKLNPKHVLCTHNFQQQFDTCTQWSLALTVYFLAHYSNLQDTLTMMKWCENLEQFVKNNQDKINQVIMRFDACLNQILNDFVFSVKSSSAKDIQTILLHLNRQKLSDILQTTRVAIKNLEFLDTNKMLI